MKKVIIFIGIVVGLFVILLLIAGGQAAQQEAKYLDLSRLGYGYKDKKPGGTYVLYKYLPSLFYGSTPKVVTKPFARTMDRDADIRQSDDIVYMLVADKLYASERDIKRMLEFVQKGNQLFMAVRQPDSLLADRLGFEVADTDAGGNTQHFVNPNFAPDTAFAASRLAGGSYFTKLDSANTTILGRQQNQRVNFVRIHYGNGSVLLLLNPASLTNYFLVQPKNIRSLEREVAYAKEGYRLYWDEYYKYQYTKQSDDFSEWQVLMRYPAMRWALWLALLLLVLYVLFESKRRQRIIPERPVLANHSLEFVDTLGQLYYQQHDNKNLAQKMIAHWLEYVRSRFYLNTQQLDLVFATTLARKSGMEEAAVRHIVDCIHDIQLSEQVSDTYLMDFYKVINQFYLNTK
ncbi:DUF4350 domain-containing protein [Chitinophaga pendula]|uniref:DUF4350 domain-containing protein n=1 Tax=Chitinophaga TaxID=79328 RepID=UPI0012FD813E|nr:MULTISPECIES: DUF4350 domain-containing protein [Chitinophaga]UCJ05613.1 DUF4350 domain-containing protein [Chitinophaga pendula]